VTLKLAETDTPTACHGEVEDEAGPPAQPPCPAPISPVQEMVDNLPYAIMVLLGSAVLALGAEGLWRWLGPGLYAAYGLAGAVWVMLFICPWCHFYATRLCPCGYGRIAPLLRAPQGPDGFARQFRRHIPVIVPLWFIPVAAGAWFLVSEFSWTLAALLALFIVNSFLVLPFLARRYGCARCPQRDGCPWMAKCRS